MQLAARLEESWGLALKWIAVFNTPVMVPEQQVQATEPRETSVTRPMTQSTSERARRMRSNPHSVAPTAADLDSHTNMPWMLRSFLAVRERIEHPQADATRAALARLA